MEQLISATNDAVPKVLLVTGGAGFIGSNFINFWIANFPHDTIVNFDCLEAHSNLQNIQQSHHPTYTFIHGNLVDQTCLTDMFTTYPFTHIIHFAAASNVDFSFVQPLNCTMSNVLGTHILLETARTCRTLKLFIFISTDEVYGEMPNGRKALEDDTIFSPTNPYAATKAAAECLVMSYGKSYRLPWLITRANNVYGRYQYPAQAIPKFVTCLLEGTRMPVHGDGRMTRKFIHVSDKCRAIRTLIERGSVGEVYNIGAPDEWSVLELCGRILEKVRGAGELLNEWIEHVPDRCYNDCRYSVDSTKLEQLGWKPEVLFEDGLKDTVEWYRENRNHWTQSRAARVPQTNGSVQQIVRGYLQTSQGVTKAKQLLEDLEEVPEIRAEVQYA